jgi:hypothetical protein
MALSLVLSSSAWSASVYWAVERQIFNDPAAQRLKSAPVALLDSPALADRYTKIAHSGSTLPDSAVLGSAASDWACTRDNTSGLIWEVKTSDGGLRDRNRTYTDYDDPSQTQKWTGSASVNPTPAEIGAATNSIGFVAAVNAKPSDSATLCGSTGWRMPSRDELLGLVDRSFRPTINPAYFPNTASTYFWSASPYTGFVGGAWLVGFGNGNAGLDLRDDAFPVRLVHSELPWGQAVEFYHSALKHYFLASDPNEAARIEAGAAGPGWARTGSTFNVHLAQASGSQPVCRFYGSQNPGPNSHFFTLAADECAGLRALQATLPESGPKWHYEGTAFYAFTPLNASCTDGSTPVDRYYNNGFARGEDANHRLTTDPALRAHMEAAGWIYEGVVMCAP